MAQEEAIAVIRDQYPDLYAHMLTRRVPADFQPTPALTAECLANLTRLECRTCQMPLAPTGHMRCAACSVARYCDKDCQALDWADGHKRVCALDRGMKGTLKESLESGHL